MARREEFPGSRVRTKSHRSLPNPQDMEGLDDAEAILGAVAEAMEQLRDPRSSIEAKERVVEELSRLAEASSEARSAIGYHAHGIPLLVGFLRSASLLGRQSAAVALGALALEDELRVKVLLGGSIPPILALLKQGPTEAQVVAARVLLALTKGSRASSSRDNVGTRIFSTEKVVPALLDLLLSTPGIQDDVIEITTATLRNLSASFPSFWRAVEDKGGVDVFLSLLSSSRPLCQENAAALLESYLANQCAGSNTLAIVPVNTASLKHDASQSDSHNRGSLAERQVEHIVQAGAVSSLLALVEEGQGVAVRTEAAGVLRVATAASKLAREAVEDQGGVGVLIQAVVAPSAEMMSSVHAQKLQENAMEALTSMAGGKRKVLSFLAESANKCRTQQDLADSIGALAYALVVLEQEVTAAQPRAEAHEVSKLKEEAREDVDAAEIERSLVRHLSDEAIQLVQERALECLGSLYSCKSMAHSLLWPEAKRMLIGLITVSCAQGQEELVQALVGVSSGSEDLWSALRGRDGVLHLVSLLGLSTEEQQECACALLRCLTDEVEESNWAITAAGGIPPLVALLASGTSKAREDAALLLGNLCGCNEDIRACVETADAAPALINLLEMGSDEEQALAAATLTKVLGEELSAAGAQALGHLAELVMAETPRRKTHVLTVLTHILAADPELGHEGSPASDALQSLMAQLESGSPENQLSAAASLAGLFRLREELRDSPVASDAVPVLMSLVEVGAQPVAAEAAKALALVFSSIGTKCETQQALSESIFPLLQLSKSQSLVVAEIATTALADLFQVEELTISVPVEDAVVALTRMLREGNSGAQARAAVALRRMIALRESSDELAESIVQNSTVLALVALLPEVVTQSQEATESILESLSLLAKSKGTASFSTAPLQVLAETPYSMEPLVSVVASAGEDSASRAWQEKAVEVLSRLCKDQPVVLGDLIAGTRGCTVVLARRVTEADASLEMKVGGTALLICAAKEHRMVTMEALVADNLLHPLVVRLVEMLEARPEAEGSAEVEDPSTVSLVKSVALWLLALMASHSQENMQLVASAGAVSHLLGQLSLLAEADGCNPNVEDMNSDESGSSWVSALLLAILFCNRDVVRGPTSIQVMPALIQLVSSADSSNRYFGAQAVASLVSNGNRGTLLGAMNAGCIPALLSALAAMEEEDLSHLHALAEDFGLPQLPEQVALDKLFRCDDARIGPKAASAIPDLARILLVQIEEQHLMQQQLMQQHIPGASGGRTAAVVMGLLRQLATVSKTNRLAMAELGVIEGVTRCLSNGAQEGCVEAAVDLLRVLMTAEEEVRQHAAEATHAVVERLVAILETGHATAGIKAAGALEGLFEVDAVKQTEAALGATAPLMDMLATACSSTEQGAAQEARASASCLAKLAQRNTPRFLAIAEGDLSLSSLLQRLMSNEAASEHCLEAGATVLQAIFTFPAARNLSSPNSSPFVTILVSMLSRRAPTLQLRAAGALETLMEDDRQADAVASAGAVGPLVSLLEGDRHALHMAAVSCLFKLAKDRRSCKLDMVGEGVIDRVIAILPMAPLPLAALSVELLRVLTNNSGVARSPAAYTLLGPLFQLLKSADLGVPAQTSTLQTLVNVIDKPSKLEADGMGAGECVSPLVPLLSSPSIIVQQLAVGLLAHLLSSDHFCTDPAVIPLAARPLLLLAANDMESLRVEALKALEAVSLHWPSSIIEIQGGIEELSRVVATAQAPVSTIAAAALANVIRDTECRVTMRVPVPVFICLLMSGMDMVQQVAVSALSALEKDDPARAEAMVRQGLVETLLELLRSHQVEEPAARLLESLFNNARVRESPPMLRAIAPLAHYLVDPNSRDTGAKLLAALALGDLFQESSHIVIKSKQEDLIAVCQGMLSLLHEVGSNDLHMVALCGLQNLVASSRTNKRAVADAGGVNLLMDLLPIAPPEVASQAANLVRLLLNNHTVQEYATPELLSSLVAVVERDLWKASTANEEVLQAMDGLLHTFSRLRHCESATAAVPVLIQCMKVGNEMVQELVLNILWLLRQGWSHSKEAARLQSTAMGDAIPFLQLMLRSGPINLYEKAEALLCAIPGCLTVCLQRGSNLKTGMGVTNAYCKVTLADFPPQLTKVIQNCCDPQWKHSFAWPLDSPPGGMVLHVACKNKGTLGTSSLGKVSIPIDQVVALGTIGGAYSLQPETNKDGTQRTVEVEFTWSNVEATIENTSP